MSNPSPSPTSTPTATSVPSIPRSLDLDSFEIDLLLPTSHSWLEFMFPIPKSWAESEVNPMIADRWLRIARLQPARKLSIQLVFEDDWMAWISYSILFC